MRPAGADVANAPGVVAWGVSPRAPQLKPSWPAMAAARYMLFHSLHSSFIAAQEAAQAPHDALKVRFTSCCLVHGRDAHAKIAVMTGCGGPTHKSERPGTHGQ